MGNSFEQICLTTTKVRKKIDVDFIQNGKRLKCSYKKNKNKEKNKSKKDKQCTQNLGIKNNQKTHRVMVYSKEAIIEKHFSNQQKKSYNDIQKNEELIKKQKNNFSDNSTSVQIKKEVAQQMQQYKPKQEQTKKRQQKAGHSQIEVNNQKNNFSISQLSLPSITYDQKQHNQLTVSHEHKQKINGKFAFSS